MHGGTTDVQSSVGKGTTISMKLNRKGSVQKQSVSDALI
jgi:signal transduction histidine kinase